LEIVSPPCRSERCAVATGARARMPATCGPAPMILTTQSKSR
jgi:hypothetical protein